MCGRFYLDVDFDDILDRYGYLILTIIIRLGMKFIRHKKSRPYHVLIKSYK